LAVNIKVGSVYYELKTSLSRNVFNKRLFDGQLSIDMRNPQDIFI